jgi:putative tryptophan/tyrosine transport system substrate-binding protein
MERGLWLTYSAYSRGATVMGDSKRRKSTDRLPALATDLVRRQPAVIAASTTPSALALKEATQTVPIVFVVGTDPVKIGLVARLAQPGGNITGVTVLNVELIAKSL